MHAKGGTVENVILIFRFIHVHAVRSTSYDPCVLHELRKAQLKTLSIKEMIRRHPLLTK